MLRILARQYATGVINRRSFVYLWRKYVYGKEANW